MQMQTRLLALLPLLFATSAAAQTMTGVLDGATPIGLHGWACVQGGANAPVTVALLAGASIPVTWSPATWYPYVSVNGVPTPGAGPGDAPGYALQGDFQALFAPGAEPEGPDTPLQPAQRVASV
jgi:hypothetical protein